MSGAVLAAVGSTRRVSRGALPLSRHHHSPDRLCRPDDGHPFPSRQETNDLVQHALPDAPDDTVDPDEIVLGVDTHKDIHVAAALTALGVLLAPKRLRPPPPVTDNCWLGHANSGRCTGPEWSAQAPTELR